MTYTQEEILNLMEQNRELGAAPAEQTVLLFRIDNAAYRNGHLYLSIEYKAEREPEDQEEWSRQNAVYQVYMNNLR